MILQSVQVGKALLGCCLASACLFSSALPAAMSGEATGRDSALTKIEKERCILSGLDESAMARVKKILGSTFDLVDLEDQKLVTSSLDCVFDEAESALVLRDWRRISEEHPQFATLVKKEEARFRKVNLLRDGCTLPGSASLSSSNGSVKLVSRFVYSSKSGTLITSDDEFLTLGDNLYRQGLSLYALPHLSFSRAFLNHTRGDEYARSHMKSLSGCVSSKSRAVESFRVTAKELADCDKFPLDECFVGGPLPIVRLPAGATVKQVSGDVFEVRSRYRYLVPVSVQPVLLSRSEDRRAVLKMYLNSSAGRRVDQGKLVASIERILNEYQGRIVSFGHRNVIVRLGRVPSGTGKFFNWIYRDCPGMVDLERLNKLRPLFLSREPERRLFVLQWQ